MENQILDHDLEVLLEQNRKKEFAGFWVRVGASLIDVLVFLPLMGLYFYNTYSWKSFELQLALFALLTVYKPLMEFRYGATLGKMAVKIKVVNSQFGDITFTQALVRYFPSVLSQAVSLVTIVLLFQSDEFLAADSMLEITMIQNTLVNPMFSYIATSIYFVSCFFVAFTEDKQALHDMAAKTYCISMK